MNYICVQQCIQISHKITVYVCTEVSSNVALLICFVMTILHSMITTLITIHLAFVSFIERYQLY